MKSISGALLSLLNSNSFFYKADLYTWTFQDGTILRTTDADVNLTFGGFTFLSCAPIIERTKVKLVVGVEVDSIDVTVSPSPSNTLSGGLSWKNAARQGYLDGAKLLVETAYLQTWPVVVGTLHTFQGLVSDIYPDRFSIRITVKSALELLVQQFPINIYQSTCLHTVYDAGCTLAKTSFTATGTISGTPTATSFTTALGQAAGYFDQGVVTFTSGANNGVKRTVKSFVGGVFTFALPLPVPPSAGDTISVFAGCDHTLATCRAKFSNDTHFRGAPWVPTPEMSTPAVAASTTSRGK